MANPYHLILANQPLAEVLKATAKASQPELDQAIEGVTDDQILHLGIWTENHLRANGAKNALVEGCLLYLIHQATEGTHEEAFRNVVQDSLGISKTQAYRKITGWRRFGKTLTQDPILTQQFVCEALLILAADQTPEEARTKAIELAAQGEVISIKKARQLQQEFSEDLSDDAPAPIPAPRRESPDVDTAAPTEEVLSMKQDWFTFVGKVARIVVNPSKATGQTDLQSIIADLEAALEKFRRQFQEQKSTRETIKSA